MTANKNKEIPVNEIITQYARDSHRLQIPCHIRDYYNIEQNDLVTFEIISFKKCNGGGGNGGNADQSVPSSGHKTKEVEQKHV